MSSLEQKIVFLNILLQISLNTWCLSSKLVFWIEQHFKILFAFLKSIRIVSITLLHHWYIMTLQITISCMTQNKNDLPESLTGKQWFLEILSLISEVALLGPLTTQGSKSWYNDMLRSEISQMMRMSVWISMSFVPGYGRLSLHWIWDGLTMQRLGHTIYKHSFKDFKVYLR